MPATRIEDYALIGNCSSAALVARNGSMDWLTLPRFDSAPCFAALLGDEDNGCWLITPQDDSAKIQRRYQGGTLVLETEFTTPEGRCVLIDCMDLDEDQRHVLRLVRGISGSVKMCTRLKLRFEFGSVIPWVRRLPDGRLRAMAGPDQLVLATSVEMRGEDMATVADFEVTAGEEHSFALSWRPSHLDPPDSPNVPESIERVAKSWKEWSDQHVKMGEYDEAVLRSILVLKALSHHETGGIIAAPTTSLPEQIGGPRNWDYRYCWLRDATFTLLALMNAGFASEARSWRDWLLRAVAGSVDKLQIMYGVAGERLLTESTISWLSGYENSQPVRTGNAASEQLQLDVYGEVVDLLFLSRNSELDGVEESWGLERALINHLIEIWREPDSGIWEVRGPRRHFTHSKAMAWVALDRGIRGAEQHHLKCDLDEWKKVRDEIDAEVCAKGFDPEMNSFTQYFGGKTLDASLLMLPLIGFLPPDDPRIVGTVTAIEKALLRNGFVERYNTDADVDGLPGSEGAFLACSFWLVENYVLQKRDGEAREMFERLLALRNDVGLLAEEWDIKGKRQLGNFPQAFSHVALVNAAHILTAPETVTKRSPQAWANSASGLPG